jgi:hypothetical protein
VLFLLFVIELVREASLGNVEGLLLDDLPLSLLLPLRLLLGLVEQQCPGDLGEVDGEVQTVQGLFFLVVRGRFLERGILLVIEWATQ